MGSPPPASAPGQAVQLLVCQAADQAAAEDDDTDADQPGLEDQEGPDGTVGDGAGGDERGEDERGENAEADDAQHGRHRAGGEGAPPHPAA